MFVALIVALLPAAAATQSANQTGLEGLWGARERYGPDIRGTLLILQRGRELHADIAGFSVPVRVDGQRLYFALPDGKGSFRGTRSGPHILGQWIQGGTRNRGRYATPVQLRATGRNRWHGLVVPLEDTLTYYLPIARSSSGAFAAHLRNPERNDGRLTPVSTVDVRGEAVRLIGRRGGAQADTVFAEGRYDAEADLLRLPLGRSSFDFARVDGKTSSAFYPRGNPAERYRYSPPVQLDDGWPVATLEQEGISRVAIERFVQKLIDAPMDSIGSSQVHGLLIARHGRLVLEEYFHGHSREMAHDTRSASKSWTAVLIGAAVESGIPIRLDTPVYSTMLGRLPVDIDPRKRAMTLEHLVSMTAGFDCAENNPNAPGHENRMQDQTEQPDWYRFTMNLPLVSTPGERIVYCSPESNLAAGVLEKVAGEPLVELFDRLVATPLRMGPYHLQLTPTGTAYGGGGHFFRPRDYLKLPQLMLNEGKWDNRQIVDKEWARQSVRALRSLTSTQQYGWLWNAQQYPYRERTVHAFFAAGNGGQIFMGIPELNLAIAFTGGNYNDNDVLRIPQRVFVPEDILPAVN